MPKTPKTKAPAPSEANKVETSVNYLHQLPFEDRMKGFDAEYKALSNKWGIYHLPVTIFDDSTIPGGRFGQQLNAENTVEEVKTAKEV